MAEAVEAFDVPPEDLPGSAGAKARGEDITTLAVAGGRGGAQVPGQEPVSQEDITSIVGRPSGFDLQPVPPELIERKKVSAKDADTIANQAFGIVEGDLNRLHRIVNAEGVGPDELPMWNAEQERRKYEYDPIQAFGSIGSVFATIASAFTRRPMINALNASAAAMEATKEAKATDYKLAYQAWKDNTDLVIHRHGLMHQQYADGADLAQRDLALGKIQIENTARKFDDQATIYFMEHGMWKEWSDAQAAQATAVSKLGAMQDDMAHRLAGRWALNSELHDIAKDPNLNDSQKKAAAVEAIKRWGQEWATGSGERSLDRKERAREFDIRQREAEARLAETQQSHRESEDIRRETIAARQEAEQERLEAKKDTVQQKRDEKLAPIQGFRDELQEALTMAKQAKAEGRSVVGIGGAMQRAGEFIGGIPILSTVTGARAGVEALGADPEGTPATIFAEKIHDLRMKYPSIARQSARVLKADKADIDAVIAGLTPFENTEQAVNKLEDALKRVDSQIARAGGQAPASDKSDKRPAYVRKYDPENNAYQEPDGNWYKNKNGKKFRIDPDPEDTGPG